MPNLKSNPSPKSSLEVKCWAGILIASPFLQGLSSSQKTFPSFLRCDALSSLGQGSGVSSPHFMAEKTGSNGLGSHS